MPIDRFDEIENHMVLPHADDEPLPDCYAPVDDDGEELRQQRVDERAQISVRVGMAIRQLTRSMYFDHRDLIALLKDVQRELNRE